MTRTGDGRRAGVRTLAPDDLPRRRGDRRGSTGRRSTTRTAWSPGPGNRVARISPLVPGVDLVGTVLASDDPSVAGRPARSSSTATTSAWPTTAGSPSWPGCPAGVGGPAARRVSAARQAAIIGTAGFTAALSLAPAGAPRARARRRAGAGDRGLRRGRAAWRWRSARRAATRWWPAPEGPPSATYLDRPRGRRGHRPRRPRRRRRSGPSGPSGGPAPSTAWAGPPWPRSCGPCATGPRWRPAGSPAGAALETSVYPFIVRNVSLLGVDTRADPDRRAARGLGARWPTAFPPALLEDMVERRGRPRRAGPGARAHPGRPGAGPDAGPTGPAEASAVSRQERRRRLACRGSGGREHRRDHQRATPARGQGGRRSPDGRWRWAG